MEALEAHLSATAALALHLEGNFTEGTRAMLETALLNSTTPNKQYRREVMQLWACHLVNTIAEPYVSAPGRRLSDANLAFAAGRLVNGIALDVGMGEVLAELGARKLEGMAHAVLPTPPDDVAARLVTLVERCAIDCNYDKFGDAYLWRMLRSALPAEVAAALCDETPYEAIARLHGRATNDLVQGWIRTLPQHLPARIDYTGDTTEGICIIAGILQEHLDNVELRVAINGADCYDTRFPALLGMRGTDGMPDTVAVVDGTTVWLAAASHAYASVVLKWAQLAKCDDLATALLAPADLLPTSTLRQYC